MSEIEKIKQKMLQRMMSASKEEKKEMPKKPIKITDENFDEVISKYDVVVVDFYADWCGPCRMLAPVIEELVMSIPTLIMFKNGKMVDRNVGALPADMLRDWIERYI